MLANGKVWVNYGEMCNWFTCEDNVVEGRHHKNADGTHTFVLSALYNDKEKNISQRFGLHAVNVSTTGTHTLKPDNNIFVYLMIQESQNNFYQLHENSTFNLTITRLDTINHIVSGEFSGVLHKYEDPGQHMTITEGRFDTKLLYSR